MPPPLPAAAVPPPRRIPDESGRVPKATPGRPGLRLPRPPPVPTEAKPRLRAVPPPPPSSPPAPEKVALTRSAPPPAPPPGTLPPRYRPPIPDDDDDADTLIENLEEDSFELTLRGDLAPPRRAPRLEQMIRMLEVSVDDVLERVDEALLSMTEQRVVRPLYLIGGATAVRAMIVPAFLLFGLGVFVGTPSADRLRKTFPKAEPETVAAATAPAVFELPAPAPPPAPPATAEAPAAPAAPVAAPVEPEVTDAQREARRRRWRARRMRRARARRAQARRTRARQLRRARARRARGRR